METNIFKILEVDTKENIHSAFIASIINANSFAREKFVEILKEKCVREELDYKKLKASTEKVLSSDKSARVDIYLSDFETKNKGNTRIIIENKLFAGDQKKQLKKYHDHLKPYDKKALFYLTIEGKDASYYSTEGLRDYYRINYKDDITKWLNAVKENEEIVPKFKTYIDDYLAIIEELSVYNSLLETGFDENKKLKRYKFNALLELRFWQELETEVLERFGGEYSIDYKHRYYSYSKILKTRNPNARGEKPRDYGIILGKNEKNQSPNFRICVKHSSKKILLSLKSGWFIDGNWEDNNDPLKITAHIKNYINIVDLAELKKIGDFEEPTKEIISKLEEFIHLCDGKIES